MRQHSRRSSAAPALGAVRARQLRGMIGALPVSNAELKKVLMVTVRLSLICTKGTDDMSDHDEWISYSHWGMFTLERKSSRQSN